MNRDKDLTNAKGAISVHRQMPLVVRLCLSIAFLIGAIIYTISPIDIIPDVLGPIGWVDDILIWVLAIVVDMKLLLQRGVKKIKAIDTDIKKQDGFFSEDVNDR